MARLPYQNRRGTRSALAIRAQTVRAAVVKPEAAPGSLLWNRLVGGLSSIGSAFVASKIALITVPVILIALLAIGQQQSIDYSRSILLREVNVPQALAKRGFTSRELGTSLVAGIEEFAGPLLSVKDFKKLQTQVKLPDFDIAGTGISTSMITQLLDSVRSKQGVHMEVSIQCEEVDCAGDSMLLTVMIDNHDTGERVRKTVTAGTGSTATPVASQAGEIGVARKWSQLIRQVVPLIFEQADPFVLAAHHFRLFDKSKYGDETARERAFDYASRVVHTQPGAAHYAHNLIGQIYRFEKRYELAKYHFLQSIKAAQKNNISFGLAYHNLANMTEGQSFSARFAGDEQEYARLREVALGYFDKALRTGVSDRIKPYTVAFSAVQIHNLVRLKGGKYTYYSAIARYRHAAKIAREYHNIKPRSRNHPALAFIYENLAAALQQNKQTEKALVAYRNAATASPRKASLHRRWGELLANQKQLTEAGTVLERARVLYSRQNSPQTLARVETKLAEVAMKLKQPKRALAKALPILERTLPDKVKKPAARVAFAAASGSSGPFAKCSLMKLYARFKKLLNKSEMKLAARGASNPHPRMRACIHPSSPA